MFNRKARFANAGDAELVMHSLGGSRDAFCHIVTRYQNLLCSLAYSSLGDLKYAEDIAQETFVEAWRKLESLHEPAKLKAWLCGILRFKISHHRRRSTDASLLDTDESLETTVCDTSPKNDEKLIDDQQQKLMWQAIKNLDANYREPLILFYREQQSVSRVAMELDLTEEATKQRLSRGRKLLKQALADYVEDALAKSKPGAGFTSAVLLAINVIPAPAKAAAIGGSAIKTGSAFKFATLVTFMASISGLISAFFGLQASLDQSRTQRERQHVIRSVVAFIGTAIVFVGGLFSLKLVADTNESLHLSLSIAAHTLVLVFVATYFALVVKLFNKTREIRGMERIFQPEAFSGEVDQVGSNRRDIKTKLTLFGVPLVHIQLGSLEPNEPPAYGWIAGGSHAYGLLVAWGGVAVAPVSVGIVSVGIITIGSVGIGIFSTGAVAIGVIAFGTSAIAYKAYAALSALGWESAFSNGFSAAWEAAIGPVAFAHHVNSDYAGELTNLTTLGATYQWVLAIIALMVIIPSALHARAVRKRIKR